MNNTLTGLGLALVIALVAALIGPQFINWTAYRGDFAGAASAVLGAPVTVAGSVDARLLPSPYVRFRDVTAGAGKQRLAVAEVEIQLAVAPLLRGEFKAERLKLRRPRLDVAAAADGTVETPFSSSGRGSGEAERISFDRAEIVDGAVTVASPAGLVMIHHIDGVAEAGSLKGPFRFEGVARSRGVTAAVRLSTGRVDPDGAIRLKLDAAPEGRPETVALDGALTLSGRPAFDGQIVLARPQAKAAEGGSPVEPWRMAARLKGDAAKLSIGSLDLSYGPDERGLRLAGQGSVTLGASPRFDLAVEGRQLDLDRLTGAGGPRAPGDMLAALGSRFAAIVQPPLPGRMTVDLGGVLIAGDVVQDFSAALSAKDGGWRIESLSAELPGAASIKTAGAVAFGEAGPGFAGRVDFGSRDLAGFRRWLAAGPDQSGGAGVVKRVAIGGDVTARIGSVAVENAVVTVDGAASKGRVAWRGGNDRPQIEASLVSDRLDLDALGLDRLVTAGLHGAAAADVALSLDAKSLVFGGVTMSGVRIDGALDEQGVDLTRLNVADVQGAALSGSGRAELGDGAGDGKFDFQVSARSLAPFAALARAAGAPETAVAAFEARASALAPLKLQIGLKADADGSRLVATGDGAGGSIELALSSAALSPDAESDLTLKIASPDGKRLASLIGLELGPLADPAGGEISLKLKGAPSTGMRGEGRFSSLGLELSGRGAVALAPLAGLSAEGDVALKSDDLSALGEALGRFTPGVAPALPVALTAKARFGAEEASFEGVKGEVAGRALSGSIVVPYDARAGFRGEASLDRLSFAELAGLAVSPDAFGRAVDRRSAWPAATFAPSPARGLSGRMNLAVAEAALTGGQVATGARFTLAFRPNAVSVDGFSGDLDGGRLTGSLSISRSGPDASVALNGALSGVSADRLLGLAPTSSPLSGAADIALEAQGAGRGLAGIVASLNGAGSATLSNGAIRRLDPAAIEGVEPQVEAGLALEAPKIAQAIDRALGGADLPVARATLPFTMAGGVVRSGALASDGPAAKLGGGVVLDLNRLTLDADLTLSPAPPDAPQIGVSFEGPLAAPRRRVDATSFTGWLSVRAVERETRRIEVMEADMRARAQAARQRADEARQKAEEARQKAEAERRKQEAEDRALIDAMPRPASPATPAPIAPYSSPALPSPMIISPTGR
ncbi:AsmA family protein [Hansschlegelia plantiphila]|uniref:Membrane protein n=1 Tax=Hansschlegelia plantiphila TaxID=374655 RepID=A0A9W6IZD9_9HYPH|nr:AsmA-like C-terminal region-containing protein [Hansschlegelia plantiphila]GLK67966.1 membrane protein [Hansschlegelia plantiphila]